MYRVENLDHRTTGAFVTYGAGHRPILHRSFSLRRVLGMSTATARTLYDATLAAILTVAVGGAVYAMSGAANAPQGGPTLPQVGAVVTSYDSSRVTFNPDATLDRSQVAGR
jgi:hypothetical protein